MFQLFAQDRQSKARRGRLTTAHGVIETPAFMPVGTQGSVKAVTPRELRELSAQSMEMTTRWARRCTDWKRRNGVSETGRFADSPIRRFAHSLLFGIVQGATFDDLRKSSVQAMVDLDFDGYAIGGVSVGEPEVEMMRAVEASELFLPKEKPRYAMGLGTPPQLLEMIARGMDMFDCALPTRLARN